MRHALHNGHVLGAAGLLAPVIGVYAPRSLAALIIVTALAAIAVGRARGGPWPIPRQRAAFILAGLLVWALASVIWGIEAKLVALSGVLRLTVVIASGLVVHQIAMELESRERETVRRWLVAGFILALALLAIDRASDASIRRLFPMSPSLEYKTFVMENFNRGISNIALLSFPAALALWRIRPAYAIPLWGAAFVLAFTLPSGSARFAFVAGALAAGCAWIAPRITARTAALLLAGLVLIAPLLASAIPSPDKMFPIGSMAISNSGHHRLQIWRFTADRIAERPLFGWGYDSSRVIPGNTVTLASAEPALPLHPHNAMLQWWLELGLPGAVFGAALVLAVGFALLRKAAERGCCAAGVGQFVAALVMADLSFGTWQGWWVAALALSATMLTAVCEKHGSGSPRPGARTIA